MKDEEKVSLAVAWVVAESILKFWQMNPEDQKYAMMLAGRVCDAENVGMKAVYGEQLHEFIYKKGSQNG